MNLWDLLLGIFLSLCLGTVACVITHEETSKAWREDCVKHGVASWETNLKGEVVWEWREVGVPRRVRR